LKSALTDACTIRLNNFEGPFDLLFYLIEKNKIDIYDIPISEITDQYMEYLAAMQELDLDIASEFLVMAATLLHIKSSMLLPRHDNETEEGPDPREELVHRLVAYKKYKDYAAILKEREVAWSRVHYKLPEAIPVIEEETELDVSPLVLRQCMVEVLNRYRERMNDDSRKMQRILDREKVSLRSKIREILGILSKGMRFCFTKVFSPLKISRIEIATGFLAMLEIVKMGRAGVEQPVPFGDIYVMPRKPDGKQDGSGTERDVMRIEHPGRERNDN